MNILDLIVLVQSSSNLLRMIIWTIAWSSFNMGHAGSKTRSLGKIIEEIRSVGQIIEKPCEHLKGHSYGPIFIKIAQNDHLDNILVKF